MSERLKIHTAPSAFPNPQRVRLFMHEKGVADQFDEQLLDMAPGGEQRSWQHYARNPFGEAPTLEWADGSTLSETPAIVHYIDQSYDGRKVTGADALTQARDMMWDQRCYLHVLLSGASHERTSQDPYRAFGFPQPAARTSFHARKRRRRPVR